MRRYIAALLLVTACCGVLSAGSSNLVERDVYLMGTRAHLLTYAATRTQGLATLDRALTILENAEAELSTWREDSAVSRLNQQPLDAPWRATTDLCNTLAAVYEWREATNGAFDPAIGRLTSTWDIHGTGRIPHQQELREARAASGLHLFAFDASRCEVRRRHQDAALDVGGFGKGDALDRVARALGDVPWLIDVGGQIAVRGLPPGANGWTVSVAHPLVRTRAYFSVRLRDGSLATSAGSERDLLVDGKRIGHILDPRTGEPAAFRGSVTVWHQRALVADMLSTALYVMGPVEGLRWAEARGLSVCFLVPRPDRTVLVAMSDRFRRLTS